MAGSKRKVTVGRIGDTQYLIEPEGKPPWCRLSFLDPDGTVRNVYHTPYPKMTVAQRRVQYDKRMAPSTR